MNWKRAVIMTLVSLGIGVAIFLGMRTQPLEVETAPARIGPMEMTVEEEGKTRLRDRYVVAAPVAGILRRHDWKVGDSLPAGRPIAFLTPSRAEVLDTRRLSENQARLQAASAAREGADARLRSMQEQVKSAEADAEYWKQQLSREEKLLAGGDIPASRIDRTRTEVKRAEAARLGAEQAVALARAEIDRARADVEAARAAATNPGMTAAVGAPTMPVYSPVSGRVVRVIRQSESPVMPGDPILELGNTRALEVEVELLSADAVKVGPGTPVRLSRWGGEGVLSAQVRLVEPTGYTKLSALGVEEQRVRVIADLVSPASQWERLGEGYRVEAAFVLWSGDHVLQIPASALFREGGQWGVFVVAGGTVQRRAVTIGHRNGLAAEVLSGLKEGEAVVPHPDDKIREGVAVVNVAPKTR
jgi:HlyD family secretion protein